MLGEVGAIVLSLAPLLAMGLHTLADRPTAHGESGGHGLGAVTSVVPAENEAADEAATGSRKAEPAAAPVAEHEGEHDH